MEIFKLFGSIFIENDKANESIDKTEAKAGKTSETIANLGKVAVAAGALIGGAFIAIATSAVKDLAETERIIAQLDSVLESTGGAAGVTRDQALSLADALEKTTKFSAESTLEAENLLLTFTNIGTTVFPLATQTMLDMATAMGTDASGGAIQLGKALNDPTAGISALSRVGVTFTEKQKNLIKSLQDTGDMAGAQKVILAELTKEFGGSAEAAGKTFGGQLEIAKNAVGNITESLAVSLMPTLQSLLEKFIESIPSIQEMGDKLLAIGASIVEKVKPALDLVRDGLIWVRDNSKFVKEAVELITVVFLSYHAALVIVEIATKAQTIAQNIQKGAVVAYNIVMGLATAAQWGYLVAMESGSIGLGVIAAAQWVFNTAMSANPIGVVIIALTALGVAIYAIVKHWKDVVEWIKKAWDWLTKWNSTPVKDKQPSTGVGVIDNNAGKGGVAGFAIGTNYVPRDMTANIHQGELIVPAKFNPYNPNATSPLGANGTATIIVELDGRQIAKAVGEPLVELIRVKTGVTI